MIMDTPVLLIAWRRPDTLRQVINAIRPVAPTRLFVACDGPNPERHGEAEKVAATRKIIDQEIDWPCQIERLYADTNQGCRLGVSRAITWFFEQVHEGIVLEDDCVPHIDFFKYCTTLLERYRHDTRVWCISGNNFQNGHWRGDGDYYYSRYNHCWGWATWRRCWIEYDSLISSFPEVLKTSFFDEAFQSKEEKDYWERIFTTLYLRQMPDTWDYQWTYVCLINNGLTALPNVNLVTNIGFGADATHTFGKSSPLTKALPLNKFSKPSSMFRFETADSYTFKNYIKPSKITRLYAFFKQSFSF
jgi:hypothetical protein